MTPIQANKKINEKTVFDSLKDNREKNILKFKLGQPNRTADYEKVFSKGDSTNWSNNLNTITEVIHDTIPSNPIN